MPKRYRDDSLVIYEGKSDAGWDIIELPFPEDEAGRDAGSVIVRGGCWARTKAEAVRIARQNRRELGGCWHVKPVEA